MPIDRGPWTALVDDDGSNLVGSIWNKDKIKTVILDPTDAAIAAQVGLPTGGANNDLLTRDLAVPTFGSKWAPVGVWIDIPYAAANFTGTNPMVWTVTQANQIAYSYMVLGRTLFIVLTLQATTVTGAAGSPFVVKLPTGYTPIRSGDGVFFSIDAGAGVVGRARFIAGTPNVYLYRLDGANWNLSAANTQIAFQTFYTF